MDWLRKESTLGNDADEIMDIKTAAKYLHVKERTLYSLVKNQKVPGIKIGGQWRFKKKQLDAMFEQK
jgi:excisionase family DNA binding protein